MKTFLEKLKAEAGKEDQLLQFQRHRYIITTKAQKICSRLKGTVTSRLSQGYGTNYKYLLSIGKNPLGVFFGSLLITFKSEIYSQVMEGSHSRQAIDTMKREIETLETNRAPIQVVLRSIYARENCLKALREHIDSMIEAEESRPNMSLDHEPKVITKVIALKEVFLSRSP